MPEKLSKRQLCDLLSINTSRPYYKGNFTGIDEVELMNIIREVWTRYPLHGYRRITKELGLTVLKVNLKYVQWLMQLGGIQAILPGPNTNRVNKLHVVHPYLLQGLEITHLNQAVDG